MDKLKKYIIKTFGVNIDIFYNALISSPSAQGYIHGAISEVLLKQYLEERGYEVIRIKEKPEGGYKAKNEEARGDFYIRKKGVKEDKWLVVECKGVKSNSEKRNGLIDLSSCMSLLYKHSVIRNQHIRSIYISGKRAYEKTKRDWRKINKKIFPQFKWNKINPGAGIPNLTGLWGSKEEIEEWLNSFPEESYSESAYWNLKAPIRLLQTHMPSTRTDPITNIKSTGPLVNEFNILSVDLFIKTGKHEFIFANSAELNPQAKSPNHLQQNYTIDILTEKDKFIRHKLLKPWYDDIDKCIHKTKPIPRKLDKTQIDNR